MVQKSLFENILKKELNTINELFHRPAYDYKVRITYIHPRTKIPHVVSELVKSVDSANEAFAVVHTKFCEDRGIDPGSTFALSLMSDFTLTRSDGKKFTKDNKDFDIRTGWAQEWHPTSAVDPLKHIPDEELINTPEREWITKIPYARLQRIIQKFQNLGKSANWNSMYRRGYAKGEIIVKATMIGTYICQGLVAGLERNIFDRITTDADELEYLMSVMNSIGIDFGQSDKAALIESMIDSVFTNDKCEWTDDIPGAFSNICNKIGISISEEEIEEIYRKIREDTIG
jgi:hypothetical protein